MILYIINIRNVYSINAFIETATIVSTSFPFSDSIVEISIDNLLHSEMIVTEVNVDIVNRYKRNAILNKLI